MGYDPFARGPMPVGVTTVELSDPARNNRPLITEVWYPAADAHQGEDSLQSRRSLPSLKLLHERIIRLELRSLRICFRGHFASLESRRGVIAAL